MDILPRELQLAIIKKMDIDTRRKIGIYTYTKLKIPQYILSRLNNIPKISSNNNSLYIVKLHLTNEKNCQNL